MTIQTRYCIADRDKAFFIGDIVRITVRGVTNANSSHTGRIKVICDYSFVLDISEQYHAEDKVINIDSINAITLVERGDSVFGIDIEEEEEDE